MNRNEILDLLTCPRGCEGTLSQENLKICADEYQGNLKCRNCEYLLPFVDGVIDLTDNINQEIKDIDSYNLKYPDDFYLDIARESGFNLKEELYSNQEIFFVLNRASNRNLAR